MAIPISIYLTKTGGILGPIADLMGIIMDGIFRLTSQFGFINIGLCIILFTIATRLIMLPLSYKQAKSQKIMSVLQPEIAAIQKKYKGKENDQQAMMMQNAEIKAVYEKYGTSMTGGCVQLLIQMPIIFALYRVILNIPAYVPAVKEYFSNVVNAVVSACGGTGEAIAKVNEFAHSSETLTKLVTQARISEGEISTTDHIIDFLYNLNPAQWADFSNQFPQASAVINQNADSIAQMNNFFGINLATSPGAYMATNGLFSVQVLLIPILAGLSQYLATKLMQSTQTMQLDENNPTASTMKTMNYMFPIMSVVFCFSFASGIGVYWIASSVIMGLQQYLLNRHFAKMDVDEMVKQNIEKVNAKRAKKGLPPVNEKAAEDNFKRLQEKEDRLAAKRQAALDRTKEQIEASNQYYKTGSIAERAQMVQRYNEKNEKKK